MKKTLIYLSCLITTHANSEIYRASPSNLIVTKDSLHPAYQIGGWGMVKTPKNTPTFPGYDSATRIIEFSFIASSDLIETSHASVHINVGENQHQVKLTRGLIIGNLKNRIGGCPFPSVQIEAFNTGDVHYNHLACKRVYPNVKYTLTLGISKNHVAFILMDQLGNIVTKDAVDAGFFWSKEEQKVKGLSRMDIPDYAVKEVGFAVLPIYPKSTLKVMDIKLGFYKNKISN